MFFKVKRDPAPPRMSGLFASAIVVMLMVTSSLAGVVEARTVCEELYSFGFEVLNPHMAIDSSGGVHIVFTRLFTCSAVPGFH